jgi:hypothetical protein
MRPSLFGLCACLATAGVLIPNARAADDAPIDVARGKQLMARYQSGEKLSPEDEAYLDRVKQEMRKRAGAGKGQSPSAKPKPPSPDSRSAAKVDTSGLVPLTELSGAYKGEDGGLYGGGSNEMPEAHRAAYAKESQKIRPLDAEGNPSDSGKIGFITVGFSNPNLESVTFKRTADADSQKSAQVQIVNGCIGGRAAVMWAWDGSDMLPEAEQARLDKEMDLLADPGASREAGRSFARASAGGLDEARRGASAAAGRVSGSCQGVAGRHGRHFAYREEALSELARGIFFQPHLRRLGGSELRQPGTVCLRKRLWHPLAHSRSNQGRSAA